MSFPFPPSSLVPRSRSPRLPVRLRWDGVCSGDDLRPEVMVLWLLCFMEKRWERGGGLFDARYTRPLMECCGVGWSDQVWKSGRLRKKKSKVLMWGIVLVKGKVGCTRICSIIYSTAKIEKKKQRRQRRERVLVGGPPHVVFLPSLAKKIYTYSWVRDHRVWSVPYHFEGFWVYKKFCVCVWDWISFSPPLPLASPLLGGTRLYFASDSDGRRTRGEMEGRGRWVGGFVFSIGKGIYQRLLATHPPYPYLPPSIPPIHVTNSLE